MIVRILEESICVKKIENKYYEANVTLYELFSGFGGIIVLV